MITKTKKKLTPASIAPQKNRRRQESFLPVDAAYLNSNPTIIPDKYVGGGACGDVYTIKGNRHMVVKVPREYVDRHTGRNISDRRYIAKNNTAELEDEYDRYVDLGLEKVALFTPTKKVTLPSNELGLSNVVGLVRPRVRVMNETMCVMNNKQFEMLRKQLISISYEGLIIPDRLQVGIDKSGKPLLYDLGWCRRTTPSRAFIHNNSEWRHFLNIMTERRGDPYLDMKALLAKYGEVIP